MKNADRTSKNLDFTGTSAVFAFNSNAAETVSGLSDPYPRGEDARFCCAVRQCVETVVVCAVRFFTEDGALFRRLFGCMRSAVQFLVRSTGAEYVV